MFLEHIFVNQEFQQFLDSDLLSCLESSQDRLCCSELQQLVDSRFSIDQLETKTRALCATGAVAVLNASRLSTEVDFDIDPWCLSHTLLDDVNIFESHQTKTAVNKLLEKALVLKLANGQLPSAHNFDLDIFFVKHGSLSTSTFLLLRVEAELVDNRWNLLFFKWGNMRFKLHLIQYRFRHLR